MRHLILILLILTNVIMAHSKDCIPKGTSFVEVLKMPELENENADGLAKALAEQIEAMMKYRKQNCDATPQMIFDNCRSSCVIGRLPYRSYRDTCRNYCAIQKLKIESVELRQCNDKLKAITQIEKDIRARDKHQRSRADK